MLVPNTGIGPPHLGNRYTEEKMLFMAFRERTLGELFERLNLDKGESENDTARSLRGRRG